MTDLRIAAQQALEALMWHDEERRTIADGDAITTLRAALAQQAEPMQAISECLAVLRPMVKGKFPHEQALEELVGYTAPPERLPLTEEEIDRIDACIDKFIPLKEGKRLFARAVEKAVWEKNHE